MWPSSVFKLTFGDFDRDGHSDLAMASSSGPESGTAVLHGHDDGLHPAPLPKAETPGVDARWPLGTGDEDFGAPVAAGDLTDDSYPDLVVGHAVILGTAGGLGPTWVDWPEVAHYGDIAVLPFSGGSHAWLAAQPDKRPPGPKAAGAVTVLRGTSTGDPGPVTVWNQDSPGIKGAAEEGDSFGRSIGGGRGH